MNQNPHVLIIHENDHVAVALRKIEAGERVVLGDFAVEAGQEIPRGHKIAIKAVDKGSPVFKYGFPIGEAKQSISSGDWVHSHNLRTALSGSQEYVYHPMKTGTKPHSISALTSTFMGYRRKNGKVGIRNELWIINTVGCVNRSAERIAQLAEKSFGNLIDGIHAFSHPYGCSQLGDDLKNTQKILSGLIRHPNAGGVLVLGLGCENNQLSDLLDQSGEVDEARIRYFNSQEVLDEIEEGLRQVGELVEIMQEDRRETCSVSELKLGMKCGGSDGLSGLTANPLVGRISEIITEFGGISILTEVPEMFGAEQLLMNRAKDKMTFQALVHLINDFKEYFERHGQPVYENPSPGNKDGGISTLEEKSLGAIQKGGTVPVSGVFSYGESVRGRGLNLVQAPGNDGVSCTAEVAAGAHLILFTTGRGTPLGFPVPTVKISTNTELYKRKPGWIDFDAGSIASGKETFESLAPKLWEYLIDLASGREWTKNEERDYREIAIWKEGVTL